MVSLTVPVAVVLPVAAGSNDLGLYPCLVTVNALSLLAQIFVILKNQIKFLQKPERVGYPLQISKIEKIEILPHFLIIPKI